MADPGLPACLPLLIESAAEKKDNNLMEMNVAMVIVSRGRSVGLVDLKNVVFVWRDPFRSACSVYSQ